MCEENATNPKATWSSDNEDVAKVDSNGVVTGEKAGSATITAKAGGKPATVRHFQKSVLAMRFTQIKRLPGDSVIIAPIEPVARRYKRSAVTTSFLAYAWFRQAQPALCFYLIKKRP